MRRLLQRPLIAAGVMALCPPLGGAHGSAQDEALRARLEARQPALIPISQSNAETLPGEGLGRTEWALSVNALYNQLDLNGDGLTLEELDRALDGRGESGSREVGRNALRAARGQGPLGEDTPGPAEVRAALEANFAFIDITGDGRVGPAEFNRRLSPLFACLDVDGDGVLDRQELQATAPADCQG